MMLGGLANNKSRASSIENLGERILISGIVYEWRESQFCIFYITYQKSESHFKNEQTSENTKLTF